jgi:hypothetical protein
MIRSKSRRWPHAIGALALHALRKHLKHPCIFFVGFDNAIDGMDKIITISALIQKDVTLMKRQLTMLCLALSLLAPAVMTVDVQPGQTQEDKKPKRKPKPDGTPTPRPGPRDEGDGDN